MMMRADLAYAQPTHLNFAVNSPGSPPFLYFDSIENRYLGLIPDLLEEPISRQELTIRYFDSNRTRSEQFLYDQKVDVFTSSIEWLKTPEKLIYTEPLLVHHSYLYSLHPFADNFTLADMENTSICTRRGYTYPKLAPFFALNTAIRVDSSSHLAMMDMFVQGRCDLIIMHESNAQSWFKKSEFSTFTFYPTPEPVNTVYLRLFFPPSRFQERDLINTYITEFKQSGRLQKSLAFHIDNLKTIKEL